MNQTTARVVVAASIACGTLSCSSEPPPDPVADLAVVAGSSPVADPKLDGFDGWTLAFVVTALHYGDLPVACRVSLSRDGVHLRAFDIAVGEGDTVEGAQCVATWDGVDDNGAFATPGPIDVRAELVVGEDVVASTEATLEVVRLGIDSVTLDGPEAAPLMYGAMAGVERGYYTIPAGAPQWRIGPDASEPADAVSLEHADGTVRALPEPWDDLRSPPLDDASDDGAEHDTYNLPAAFAAGTPIDVTATLSADIAGAPAAGAPVLHEVRVVPPAGASFADAQDGAFAPGAAVTVRMTDHPVQGVGRYDLVLDWTFEARVPGGEWLPVPGAVQTVHRIYGLAAVPAYEFTSEQHKTWVDIIDLVASWVDGQTADPIAVGARVIEGVYFEMGLVYDRESGASAYTDYPGFGFSDAQFDLSSFLDRDHGNIINCSDAASISATFMTMAGVDFRYHILRRPGGTRFDLNYIKAIGWDEFDETPFFGDRGAFSYHAVVGPTDGMFYDATLALDGDDDPKAPPHVELLAQGMVPEAYMEALSSEWELINVIEDQQVEIR